MKNIQQNRKFFLIPKSEVGDTISFGDDPKKVAFALGYGDKLDFEKMASRFEYIGSMSEAILTDIDQAGVVIGWDTDADVPFNAYVGKLKNHVAVYHLAKYGRSIDAPAMVDLDRDAKRSVKPIIEGIVKSEHFGNKKISELDYEGFEKYCHSEVNAFGETASPLIAMSVGSKFFANPDQAGIPLGNYSSNAGALSKDVLDYLGREFPNVMEIAKTAEFLNGPNAPYNQKLNVQNKSHSINILEKATQSLKKSATTLSAKI